MMSKLLTKSKFLNGLDSHALLWRVVHQPETIPPPDDMTQQIFDSGTAVGVLAQQYFNDGIDLSHLGFAENIEATKNALAQRKPIFEAGFLTDRFFARVDVLLPVKDDEWEIIEVKSSTKIKESHIHDLAYQQFVLEQCGLKIKDCKVMLLDGQYRRESALDIEKLFYFQSIFHNTDAKITKQTAAFTPKVPALAAQMIAVIDLPECPAFDMADYKNGTYSNVFKDEFKASLPKGSVFELYSSKKKLAYWLDGIKMIADVPIDAKTSDKHLVQIEVAKNNEPYLNHNNVSEFLAGLQYPIYHLDFETFNPAIPPFEGSWSYMQIPFQYSLHIEHEDGTVEHKEYLHTESTDPRRPLFEKLHQDIGDTGTVLAYYETFEKGRIKEWAVAAPEYLNWAIVLEEKMQDLLTPFKQFYYYHPEQQGSCSIKKVLPVMGDLSYDGMAIANGGEALSAYKKYFYLQEPHSNKAQLTQDMLAYCKQDTWAMVLILKRLRELVA